MNIKCDVIMDLLPLYHDNVCNDASRKLVEDHLQHCTACGVMLEKIRDNTLDKRLILERGNVVGHHTKAVKRKSLIAGISIASVLAIPVLISLIVNLATGHALDWFFIVLTSLMVLASVTVVPLIFEKNRGLWALGSFIGSLSLLLITISLFSGWDNWPFVAIVSILFGLSIPFAPYVISKLPLTGFASRHKGLLAMTTNTLLLYTVIIVVGLYARSGANYWGTAFPITTISLLLPWSLFLAIRYLKANILIISGLCSIFASLSISIIIAFIDWILLGTWYNRFAGANLFVWQGFDTLNANIHLLILLTGCIIGGVLTAIGLLRKKKAAQS